MSDRLFNEKEVRQILERASSTRSREEARYDEGVSLAELKQIGSELGFDPGHIELAAQQLGSNPSPSGLMNGRIILDRTVEREVGPEDWLGMVAAVQRYHRGEGAITQRGANYDWVGSGESGSLSLTVIVRNGCSRIRLESNEWLRIFMVSVMIPVFTLVFSMTAAKHGSLLAVIPICLTGIALLLTLLRHFRHTQAESLSDLMARLVDEVQSEVTTQTQPNPQIFTQSVRS